MDSMKVFGQLTNVSFDEFMACFQKMKKSAFRLEMLEEYNVDSEKESFLKFLGGEKFPPLGYNKDWVDLINRSVQRGIDFRRVRLIRNPIKDYVKFEVSWAYKVNMSGGDKVGIIESDGLPNFKSDVPILKDYWLFDDEHCYIMEYDFVGRFLGISRVPEKASKKYVDLKYEAISSSQDIKQTQLWQTLS